MKRISVLLFIIALTGCAGDDGAADQPSAPIGLLAAIGGGLLAAAGAIGLALRRGKGEPIAPAALAVSGVAYERFATAKHKGVSFYGIVANTGAAPRELVRITVTLLDAAGKTLAADTGAPSLTLLREGKRSPFEVLFVGDVPEFASYEITTASEEVRILPAGTLHSFTVSSPEKIQEAYTTIQGLVTNDGLSPAQSVRITVAFYDAEDLLIETSTAYPADNVLAPGQSSRFKLIAPMRHPYHRYAFFVEGSTASDPAASAPADAEETLATSRVSQRPVTTADGAQGVLFQGLVENTGAEPREFVEITVTLLDAAGQELDRESGYAEYQVLHAGTHSLFSIMFNRQVPGFAGYAIKTASSEAGFTIARSIQTFTAGPIEEREETGFKALHGAIANHGPVEATSIMMMVAFYGADGGVIDTMPTYLAEGALAPGQSARFEPVPVPFEPYAGYEFFVEGLADSDLPSATGEALVAEAKLTSSRVAWRRVAALEDKQRIWFHGMIANAGAETRERIRVTVTLLDDAGQELGSQPGSAALRVLGAGQETPFSVPFDPDAPEFASYAISIQSEPAGFVRNTTSHAFAINAVEEIKTPLSQKLRGTIANDGAVAAKFVQLTAVFYDADGRVIAIDPISPDESILQPGQSSAWKLSHIPVPSYDRCEFFVEGLKAD